MHRRRDIADLTGLLVVVDRFNHQVSSWRRTPGRRVMLSSKSHWMFNGAGRTRPTGSPPRDDRWSSRAGHPEHPRAESGGCRSAETGIFELVRLFGVLVLSALAAGLVLVGCGGEKQAAPRAPKLPRDVARSLAAKSDALAVSLERGDSCTGAKKTLPSERSAREAVSAGRIPPAFRRPLLSVVDRLGAGKPICAPPPPQPVEQSRARTGGSGPGHGNVKGEGKREKGKG